MSTLDEITKEKQRISEALARVDMQREKLASQLGELEATERVLARYSKGTQLKQTASARTPATATKAAAPALNVIGDEVSRCQLDFRVRRIGVCPATGWDDLWAVIQVNAMRQRRARRILAARSSGIS
jgi:hypothetical protein